MENHRLRKPPNTLSSSTPCKVFTSPSFTARSRKQKSQEKLQKTGPETRKPRAQDLVWGLLSTSLIILTSTRSYIASKTSHGLADTILYTFYTLQSLIT